MPLIPQIRKIPFKDEEIGMGFNSESGLAIGTALKDFSIQENPAASGQEVTASIAIVNTHDELMENLGMSFEAHGRYGFISGSAKARFSETSNFNSTSTFVVARCIVENPLRRGKNFHVTEAAQDLLDSLRFDEFRRAFGDSFIRGLQTGGEFYAVIRITSVSSSMQADLAASLHAEANGLIASGGFSLAFNKANSSANTRSEFTATMYQNAGSGAQISPTIGIGEVINRYQKFPEIASSSAAAYETEVATYDTLPLPVPTPEEQEAFLFALADAREKKLRYIQTRNDLEFALRNPIFFESLPASDVLLSVSSVYTKLINAVLDHAVKLSRGQITPPRIFDPAALSPPIAEPQPIPLRRVTPPAIPTIRVASLIGMNQYDYNEAAQCLSAGATIDETIAGTFFMAEDGQGFAPVPSISREGLEFLSLAITTWGNSGHSPQFQLKNDGEDPDLFEERGQKVVGSQFPSAGTLIAPGTEVILQWVTP